MIVKSTYADIWKVALPVILGGAAQTIINITDTIFLGRVGEVELGASAIGGILYLVMFMVGLGFSTGIQIMIARKSGERKENDIGEIFIHGFFLLGALSIVLFCALKYFSSWFLTTMVHDPKILSATLIFIDYRSYGMIFVLVGILYRSFYIGIGQTMPITWGMSVMAVSNFILNYMLVFGHFGCPQMGIAGSALASSIAEALGLVFFLWFSIRSKETEHLRIYRFLPFNKYLFLKMTSISIPIVFQNLISLGGWFIFFLVIEKTGSRNLAISNINRSILFFLMTPVWGFFAASNSMTSNIIGQGKSNEIFQLVNRISLMSFCLTALLCLLVVTFPSMTMSVFTADQSLVEAAIPSLYMVCMAGIAFSVSGIILAAVSGTGRTLQALVIEVVTILLYLGYLYFLRYHVHASIALLWTTESFYWVVIGLFSLWYLLSRRWEGKQI